MNYAKFLESNIKKEWEKNYIDYVSLKQKIEELIKKKKEAEEKYKNYFANSNDTPEITKQTQIKGQVKDDLNVELGIKISGELGKSKLGNKLIENKNTVLNEKKSDSKKESNVSAPIELKKKCESFELFHGNSGYFDKENFNHILESSTGEYIEEFLNSLEFEIGKFHLFYKSLEKKLYREVNKNLMKEKDFNNYSFKSIFKEIIILIEICELLLDVCNFVNINVKGISKVLQNFDEKFEMTKSSVALFYFGSALDDENSALRYILRFKCIDDSSALLDRLVTELEESMTIKNSLNAEQIILDDADKALKEPLIQKEIKMDELDKNQIELINSKIYQKIKYLKDKIEEVDNANNSIRSNVDVWTLVVKNNLRLISNKDTEFNIWKKNSKLSNNEIIIKNLTPQVFKHAMEGSPHHNSFNIWVCLFHTCIYALNATIVFPTNANYIESIGASSFLTGIVIASTHFAAVGFNFIYSWWTNYSYRAPMIFSLIAYLIGNALYAYSGYFGSIYPMLIGRYLIGVGSARVINRRYLIDHVEEAHLLHYSMMYVVMTSVGNVLGPLLALFLLYCDNYNLGIIRLNEYTWPAWFCNILWFILFIIVIFKFHDPDNMNKNKEVDEKQAPEYIDIGDENEKMNLLKNKETKKKAITSNNAKNTQVNEIIYEDTEENKHNVSNSFEEINESIRLKNTTTNVSSNSPNSQEIQDSSMLESVKDKPIELVEQDLKSIIKEQETSIFSYMTISFTILVLILFLIRVSLAHFHFYL